MRALSFSSVLILLPVILETSYGDALLFDHELPCGFLESVNLTGGTLYPNDSFIFNGIEFTADQYAQINYTEKDGKRLIVEPYYRGCPCKNKPCIRLCCPYGSFVVSKRADGEFICRTEEAARRILGEIINENNETKINFEQHFGLVDGVCKKHFFANEFLITDEGDVLSEDEQFDNSEYCLAVQQNENETSLHPLICFDMPDDIPPKFSIVPYVMFTSIPFIIVTILVYALIPELMTLFGKCLVAFSINLLIYNAALSYVYLNAGIHVPPTPCIILAYTTHFLYLSVALWLNVISFNVFRSFRFIMEQRGRSDQKQFIWYCAYVFTISTILTAASGLSDSIDSLPDHLKAGFGTERCAIKENGISKFLFLYLPISIIFGASLVLIVLTTLELRRLNKELASVHRSCFNHKKFSYAQYLKLFLLLGITWSMDAVSYIDPDSTFFLISDICNSTQGIIIFILLVLNKRVFLKIKKRFASSGTRTEPLSTEVELVN